MNFLKKCHYIEEHILLFLLNLNEILIPKSSYNFPFSANINIYTFSCFFISINIFYSLEFIIF